MTTDRGALAALLATMTMLASASPAMAQAEQTAPVRGLEGLANPAPQTGTSIPIPDAPKIVLPSETPAPRRATRPRAPEKAVADKAAAERPAVRTEPDSRQTRAATEPTRSSARTQPAPIATPAPEPASQPSETPSTESAPQVVAPQSVEPQPVEPQPTPDTTTQSTVTAPETGRAMPLWLSLAVVIVVLGALWALRRKPRGRRQDRAEVETAGEPTPAPSAPELAAAPEPVVISSPAAATTRSVQPVAAPVVPATPAAPKFLEPRAKTPPPAPAAPRARVTCDLRPLRAGLNLLSATVECELVVANTGTAPAEAIRAGVALLTAHAGQDTDLAQFNAAPIGRPATPPFALAPGETRTIRTVVAIARDAIRTMTAANRPMFVPVVATNILYTTAGDDAQTSRAWVVGIERVDSAKLAPFWLDAPAKMFTTVAARPHAATFER